MRSWRDQTGKVKDRLRTLEESNLKKKEMETGDKERYLSGMGKFKFYYNHLCRHAGVHRSSLRCLLHQHENLSW